MLLPDERLLLQRYFFEKYTLEQIGYEFGISKMAVSKRLKKLLSQGAVASEKIASGSPKHFATVKKVENFLIFSQ